MTERSVLVLDGTGLAGRQAALGFDSEGLGSTLSAAVSTRADQRT